MIKIVGNSLALASSGLGSNPLCSPEQLESRVRQSALLKAPVSADTARRLSLHITGLTQGLLGEVNAFRSFAESFEPDSHKMLPDDLRSFLVGSEFLNISTDKSNAYSLIDFIAFLEAIDKNYIRSAHDYTILQMKPIFPIKAAPGYMFPNTSPFQKPPTVEIVRRFIPQSSTFWQSIERLSKLMLIDLSEQLLALDNLPEEDLEAFYKAIQAGWDDLHQRCCDEPWFEDIEPLFIRTEIPPIHRQPILDKLRELLGLSTQQ